MLKSLLSENMLKYSFIPHTASGFNELLSGCARTRSFTVELKTRLRRRLYSTQAQRNSFVLNAFHNNNNKKKVKIR